MQIIISSLLTVHYTALIVLNRLLLIFFHYYCKFIICKNVSNTIESLTNFYWKFKYEPKKNLFFFWEYMTFFKLLLVLFNFQKNNLAHCN
jgi:hypothetical protein